MKKILIIGAGFLQDFVIRKAKEDGYYVLVVDGDEHAVGFQHADEYAPINIVDKEACLEYAREKEVDGVLTAATDFGVLTAAYISEQMGIPGNSYEAATIIKNKYLTKKRLIDAGADDTKQAFIVREGENFDSVRAQAEYPLMIKPCDSSGSRGVTKVFSEDELAGAIELAIANSITRGAYIESFIEGREYGVESIVIEGEVNVLGIMKKLMTRPPHYAELGHAIPSMLSPEIEDKIRTCVALAIKAVGITSGAVNVDLILTDEGAVHIVDMGARMGGNLIGSHIIPYGTGYEYMSAMIKVATGDEVDLMPQSHGAVATRLLAFDKGHIDRAPDFRKIEKEYDVEIHHHIEDDMNVNEYHSNGDGLGYIVARAETFEEATEKAKRAYEYLKEILFR